jgi:hypothetical protein
MAAKLNEKMMTPVSGKTNLADLFVILIYQLSSSILVTLTTVSQLSRIVCQVGVATLTSHLPPNPGYPACEFSACIYICTSRAAPGTAAKRFLFAGLGLTIVCVCVVKHNQKTVKQISRVGV